MFRLHFTGFDRICLSNCLRSRLAWPSKIVVYPAYFLWIQCLVGSAIFTFLYVVGAVRLCLNRANDTFIDHDCHTTTTNKTECLITRVNPRLRYVLFTQYVLSQNLCTRQGLHSFSSETNRRLISRNIESASIYDKGLCGWGAFKYQHYTINTQTHGFDTARTRVWCGFLLLSESKCMGVNRVTGGRVAKITDYTFQIKAQNLSRNLQGLCQLCPNSIKLFTHTSNDQTLKRKLMHYLYLQ